LLLYQNFARTALVSMSPVSICFYWSNTHFVQAKKIFFERETTLEWWVLHLIHSENLLPLLNLIVQLFLFFLSLNSLFEHFFCCLWVQVCVDKIFDTRSTKMNRALFRNDWNITSQLPSRNFKFLGEFKYSVNYTLFKSFTSIVLFATGCGFPYFTIFSDAQWTMDNESRGSSL